VPDLSYPIGRYEAEETIDEGRRARLIAEIAEAPVQLRLALTGLSEEQLDTPYRPGGWTVRQVVHHLADSHMNAYIRFKLGLTEAAPLIKTYDEKRWAEMPDARTGDVATSLALLDSLHRRWVRCLESLDAQAFRSTLRHPDLGLVSLDRMLGLYAWHGRHHVAHITSLRERMSWS